MEDTTPAATNPFAAMDPEMAANPQPVFSALRDSMPVMPVDGVGVVVSRRAEVDEVFRDPGTFTSNMDAVDLKNARPLIPLQIDPPEHKKYRKILDPIFAPKEMALIAEPVAQLANDLIDRFIDRDDIDFAREFSIPFPSLVFLTLLGLPLDELPRFLIMKDGIIRPDQVTGTLYGSAEMQAYQQKTADSIYEYFEEVLDEREAERRDDLLSRFLDVEVDGEKLKRTEILDICFLFLIAGLDTVSDTLTCYYAYLANHPERRQQIVDDPDIIPAAVEELLRWITVVHGGFPRRVVEDTTIGGHPVRAGELVVSSLPAADRDPAVVDDGETLDITRAPAPHVAFGHGIHHCLGAPLARIEMRAAFPALLTRFPGLRVLDVEAEFRHRTLIYGLHRLRVAW